MNIDENNTTGQGPVPGTAAETDALTVSDLAAMLIKKVPKESDASTPPSSPEETSEQPKAPPAGGSVEGEKTEETLPEKSPQPDAATEEGAALEGEEKPTREFEYPKFQKRVDELTARLKRAEEELARLKQGAAPAPDGKQERVDPAVSGSIQRLDSVEEIDRRLQAARAVLDLQAENPDGYSYRDNNGQEHELSAEQLRRMASRAMVDLTELTARREVLLERQNQQRMLHIQQEIAKAASAYPWLQKPETEQYQRALQLVRENPGLLNRPDVVWVVAGAVEAAEKRTGRGNGSSTAPPAATRPNKPPAQVPTAPAGTNSGRAATKPEAQAQRQFEETGSLRDLQNLLAARMAVRRTAVS